MNGLTWTVALRAFRAQTRVELLLASRRYENLLVTIAIPLLLLLFFTVVPVLPATGPARPPIERLVPGILAIAVISTGMVSLGIATAFERGYGVLKRLAGSPLPRWALLGAKTVAVLATVALQLVLIVLVGGVLGWAPAGGIAAAALRALPWLLLGTLAFAALGLLLAGTLRPEAVLAVANALFLLIVLLGGVVIPLDRLPGPLAALLALLPPALLADVLRASLTGTAPLDALQAAALTAWTIVLAVVTVLVFRAEPEG